MSGGDLLTNLSADLTVDRLEPTASSPALQGRTPAGEAARKTRRRARPVSEAEADGSADRGDEPEHKIDSLA
ncbi:MAG TPA: hypothetical protein VKR57_12320 [Terriglobales bacterium]|nr:hypothetical protein [Terriglobales bacterium]